MEDRIIDTFEKNTREEVQVKLINFKGYDLVDIRVWVKGEEGSDSTPTKKGISISPELLPRLVMALGTAQKLLQGITVGKGKDDA